MNCSYCGAGPSNRYYGRGFTCGSHMSSTTQSKLCVERVEHAKTRAELKAIKDYIAQQTKEMEEKMWKERP